MLLPIVGYLLFLTSAVFLCGDKLKNLKQNWKPVIYGILFHILAVFALTHLPVCVSALEHVANGVMKLKDATLEGAKFCFGYIGGGDLPFELKKGSSTFVFAFQVLPTVILVGALSAALTYLKILPFLSKIFGYLFKAIFKIRSCMGMVAVAKIFLGQLEAPLLIRNKLQNLTESEIFTILILAFSTTSAAVMPIYATVLESVCPSAMQHLIISSVSGVISALIVAAIVMPATKSKNKKKESELETLNMSGGFMDAVSKGLADGAFVWWAIVGTLLGMIALLTLVNYILALLPNYAGSPITLQRIFGLFMYPFAWIMGISKQDIGTVSQIIGTKMAVNEAVAFFDLAKASISKISVIKTIYALNNFGNFSCIGITVAGLTALIPGNKSIAIQAGKAFLGGFLATGLTATLVGIIL